MNGDTVLINLTVITLRLERILEACEPKFFPPITQLLHETERTAYMIESIDSGGLDACPDCGCVVPGECVCGECPGHPAGESDPMGQTAYCDGSCCGPDS